MANRLLTALDSFMGLFREAPKRTKWQGGSGYSVYAGIVDEQEVHKLLAEHETRHLTYQSILANTSIVAASVRYALNLIAKAEWSFNPSEADTSGEFAERTERLLMDEIKTPWARLMKRSAMYRFHGFSVQEYRVRRGDEGEIVIDDIRNRPQHTLERWDITDEGDIEGVIQRRPQDGQYLYLPRPKLLYLVDDAFSDSPTGMGVFRHLVEPWVKLKRYHQLEGFGFELDLRNLPVARAPLGMLQSEVKEGNLTPKDASKILEPLDKFLKEHTKNPQLGVLIDSATYETTDDASRPSNQQLYDLTLLSGSQTSLSDMDKAITRINLEMARILGTEQLLLGANTVGSYSLSKDKTGQFYLLIDSILRDLVEAVKEDLINTLWLINGWPKEMKPEIDTEAVRSRDVMEIAAALRDMATAGAMLLPDDPVIGEVRDLMGMSRPPERDDMDRMIDRMMGLNEPDDDDDVPDDDKAGDSE